MVIHPYWKKDTPNGKEFNVSGNFTGIIRVPRKGDDGKLLNDVDIIEYKNGKLATILMGTQGKSGVAKVENSKIIEGKIQQAARSMDIDVNALTENKIEVSSSQSIAPPSSLPKKIRE